MTEDDPMRPKIKANCPPKYVLALGCLQAGTPYEALRPDLRKAYDEYRTIEGTAVDVTPRAVRNEPPPLLEYNGPGPNDEPEIV